MLRALLLDLDGTLANTLPLLRDIYWRFVGEVGGSPSEAEFEALNGPPLPEVVRRICTAHEVEGDPAEHLARYEALIETGFPGSAPAAGAEDLLLHARRLDISCHLVTSNSATRAQAWLEASGLNVHCSVLVSGEDVTRGKPWPEPYRRAIERLDLAADETIAIEDSRSGVQSALAAGIAVLKLGPAGETSDDLRVRSIAALADAKPIISRLAGADS